LADPKPRALLVNRGGGTCPAGLGRGGLVGSV